MLRNETNFKTNLLDTLNNVLRSEITSETKYMLNMHSIGEDIAICSGKQLRTNEEG